MIEGFQEIGDQLQTIFIANYALLFYARGLLFNWKQRLCYFRVSTAIFTLITTSDLKSDTTINTLLFLKEVNNTYCIH